MADDSEDEMSANNSESETKFQEISARTDIRPKATAGCKHQAWIFWPAYMCRSTETATTIKVHR
jgi:hypothetical protein